MVDWEQKDRKKIQEVAASFLGATGGYSSQECICIIIITAGGDTIKAIGYYCCILNEHLIKVYGELPSEALDFIGLSM